MVKYYDGIINKNVQKNIILESLLHKDWHAVEKIA